MASTLAELLVRLGVDAGAYYREIAKSKREAGQLKDELVGLAKQAAAAFAAYKLVDSVREQVQALDDLDEMAQRTGASIQSLSRLKYAADLEGVQDFQGALVKLQKSLLDSSDPATDQAIALKSIGVSARDASGQLRTADQVLIDIAEAFANAPDGVSKTNVAMALFGKTGAELIPLLNNGADGLKRYADEADRFGLTVDEKAASAAAAFNDDLFRLKAQFEGVSRQVAVGILPQLREFQKTLMDPQFVEAAKTLAGGIVTAFQGAATAIEYTVNVTKWAAESLAALQGGANDLVRIDDRLGEIAERTQKLNEAAAAGAGAWDKLGLSMGETLESSKDRNDKGLAYTIQHELEFLEQERKALLERQKILQMPAKPQVPAVVAGQGQSPESINFNPKETREAAAESIRLSQDLQSELARQKAAEAALIRAAEEGLMIERDKTEVGKYWAKVASGAYAEVSQKGREYLLILAQEKDDLEAQIEAQKRAQAEHEKAMQDAAAIYEQTRTPLERYNQELENLNDLRMQSGDNGKPLIDDDTYQRRIEQMKMEFDSASKTMSQYAARAAENIQDQFADFLFDPFGQSLKDMALQFGELVRRLIAQAAAAELLGALFGTANQSTGQTTSGIFSAGGLENIFSGIFGGAFADGGRPALGKVSLVGEEGPEWFVPDAAGTIVPMQAAAGGGGGGNTMHVTQYITIQAPRGVIGQATQLQVGAAAARGLQRAQRNL